MSNPNQALCEAISGAIGGMISTTFTYPIDVVKTKMQASGTDGSAKFNSAFEYVQHILRQPGGFQILFVRGLSIKLAWSAVGKFVFYGSYAFLNGYYMSLISRGSAATVRDALIMGYLAEVLTVPCTLPFEAIATRLQTSKGTGAWGAISNIYNESGIKGFYKSLAAYWILNWQSAIVNTIFNQFKAWYSKLLPSYASLMPHYTYTFPDPMTFFWFHYEKELNGNQLNPKAIEGNKFSFWIPLFAICFSYASALFAAGYSISALPRPYRHLTRFCWVQFLVALDYALCFL